MSQKVPVIPAISDDVPINTRRVLLAMKVTIEYLLQQGGTTQGRFGGATSSTGGASGAHNTLSGLQGGGSSERYHLTAAQQADLTDGGDSSAHYHPADRDLVNATGTLPWGQVSKTGASLSDFSGSIAHNSTTAMQGGTTGERYHLTQSEQSGLTLGASTALHYHSSDRARENHTGYQSASTISDLADYIAEVTAHTSVPETIPIGGVVTIPGNRQLIIHQRLYNNGTIRNSGKLVIL